MFKNTYGQPVYTEENLFDFYMRTPDLILKNTLTDSKITIDDSLELKNIPELIKETLNNLSVEEFDENNRLNWFMPEEYQTFDIAKFVLDQCTHEEELQRAGKELLIFELVKILVNSFGLEITICFIVFLECNILCCNIRVIENYYSFSIMTMNKINIFN